MPVLGTGICWLLLQAVIIEPLAATYVPGDDAAGSGGSSSSSGVLRLMGGVPTRSLAALKRLVSNAPPGSRLCCQVVSTTGPSCAGTVQRSLAQLLALVNPVLPVHPAAAAAAADASASQATGAACGAGAGAVADGGAGHGVLGCYSALARCAVASGARSGLSALAVCSCTGRGQQLYMPAGSLASFGDVCEAAIIDRVAARSVPFAGVYVSGELGPEVQNQCVGWAQPGGQVPLQPAEMQGYTSMFAAWGCQPGAA